MTAAAPVMGSAGSMPAGGMTVACVTADEDDGYCREVRKMMTQGVDEFGLSRAQRIAMADAELAEARAIADQWKYPDGFPERGMLSEYVGLLNSASVLYAVEGLRLLSRRVSAIARELEVPRAWDTFDRLNTKAM